MRRLWTVLTASAIIAVLTPVINQFTATAAFAEDCMQPGPADKNVPWAQQILNWDRVWPLTTGQGVKVAVLDSGVSPNAQFAHRIGAGSRSYLPKDPQNPGADNPLHDCVGHGTGVASIIAAGKFSDQGIGFFGVAPGAEILSFKISQKLDKGTGSTGSTVSPALFAQAIRDAAIAGADVINMSLAMDGPDDAVEEAIDFAYEKGVVLVAAMGNDKTKDNTPKFPASSNKVIAVGAVDQTRLHWKDSRSGNHISVVGPGVDVTMNAPGFGNRKDTGTSFATAFVSGVAALIRAYYPDLPPDEVAVRIMATAIPLTGTPTQEYGNGLVDPFRAVTENINTRKPERPEGLPPVEVSQEERDAQRRKEIREQWAVGLASAGALTAGLVAFFTVALPRARRRRWLPGRADLSLVEAPANPSKAAIALGWADPPPPDKPPG